MAKEKELERQYEHLMHKRWSLKGLSNKSKYLQNQADLKELGELLVNSSANISQNLRDHPTIKGNNPVTTLIIRIILVNIFAL